MLIGICFKFKILYFWNHTIFIIYFRFANFIVWFREIYFIIYIGFGFLNL
ncbi:hypothetical protein MtrunA17_Chr1g0195161 [Medicago truncatula]|uniref:Transmembrane protein n=1 Tax=Medicago truncatula TaxID=3880 RepID=A0A396JRZ7_MEDTR|nr:hypothetical protein MtrunA17_Chr1g0195161 [Medicago truncatula]